MPPWGLDAGTSNAEGAGAQAYGRPIRRYLLDPSARGCAARTDLGRAISSTAAIVCVETGFVLYVGCHDGRLWCLSCTVGTTGGGGGTTIRKLWSTDVAAPIFASPSLAWCARSPALAVCGPSALFVCVRREAVRSIDLPIVVPWNGWFSHQRPHSSLARSLARRHS